MTILDLVFNEMVGQQPPENVYELQENLLKWGSLNKYATENKFSKGKAEEDQRKVSRQLPFIEHFLHGTLALYMDSFNPYNSVK